MNKLLVFIIGTFLVSNIIAHPGGRDASGCHTCRTNCADYGLEQGEYHCHYNCSTGSVIVVQSNSEQIINSEEIIVTDDDSSILIDDNDVAYQAERVIFNPKTQITGNFRATAKELTCY